MPHHNDNFVKWEFDNSYRQNNKIISGSDEVGLGCMAGPAVVASVILPSDYINESINDSKDIKSESRREELYEEIIANAISWKVAIVEPDIVDKINPTKSSVKGMKSSIKELDIHPDICLADGNQLKDFDDYKVTHIIKGDSKSQTIAAASIIAKVTRDRIMNMYAKMYPLYGFEKHKGYCTKAHKEAIEKYGVLPIHRLSYKPVKEIIEKR